MTTSPPTSRFSGTAPFAGRERELAVLAQRAAEARRGEPRVVVIEGQPGMGKSALLTEFARRVPDAFVIRASGAEPEMRLPYGLVEQLTASASRPGAPRAVPGLPSRALADPLAIGADLAAELGQVAPPGRLAVMIVDDAHWADPGSAAALLFALRRMHSGAFLTVLAARSVEFSQLEAGSWSRFADGDYRASRLRLEGFSVAEAQSLAQLITAAELPERAAAQLIHITGGRPGYCRAVLDEAAARPTDSAGPLLARSGIVHEETIPVPREVATDIAARAALLSATASELLDAAAVLGRSSTVAMAALLAGLPDPDGATGEIAATGLAAEILCGSGSQIQFADPLTHRAVHAQIAPTRRRDLHQRAVGLTRQEESLRHRFAAATGHDPVLAADLESAGRAAARRATLGRYKKGSADLWQGSTGRAAAGHAATGQAATGQAAAGNAATSHSPAGQAAAAAADMSEAAMGQPASAQAACWLMQASVLTPDDGASDRLVLDAVEVLLRAGDARRAEALAPRASEASPAPRRDALLGWLDLLAGRFADAEDQLRDSWQAHDHFTEPLTGAQAADGLLWCSLHAGRCADAVTMGEHAVQSAGSDAVARQLAVNDLALALAFSLRGPEALASLGTLAACAADVPLSQTGALAARGIVRVIAGDLDTAVADLTAVAGRLRSGTRHAGLAMSMLAEAESRLGAWDEAACHGELGVVLTREAGRDGDLSLVHATASLVPAGRGDWAAAAAHVDAAGAAARTSGTALGMVAWATARANLAMARADYGQVLRAVKTVRDSGPDAAAALGRLPLYPWQLLEAEALIAVGDLTEAGAALDAFDAELPVAAAAVSADTAPATSSSATVARVAAGRLRGLLAAARGDTGGSAQAFAAARAEACAADLPVQLAQLELATGQALRQAARRPEAIAFLRQARGRLAQLGAAPAIAACDQELAACGVQIGRDPSPATLGLTTTELAVARLVAVGHSNRQAAAELYVSIKGIEFHLRNIYAKLGIKSRRELAERLSDGTETLSQISTAELAIPLR